MKKTILLTPLCLLLTSAYAEKLCTGYGPQSPRDISQASGDNPFTFDIAPAPETLNLCNIHTHTNAEHRGPGFSIEVKSDDSKHHDEGYLCDETASLTKDELKPLEHPHFDNIKPGDTIEVHWVYSSCDVKPGEGLGSCISADCKNPVLRVESQVFLLVNDPDAENFNDYAYAGQANEKGLHQPKALPTSKEKPILYIGSTTGNKYGDSTCSPYKVTWNVRPQCRKLDINSLDKWGENNPFNEHHSHAIRELVESPDHLSIIE